MILPEGNSKKYIKVVIGVYVLFTIVSPLITLFTGKSIEVSNILELDKYIEEAKDAAKVQNNIQSDNESNIMNIYSSGIKEDMKAKIEAKGYAVNSIEVGIANDETYAIQSITLYVEKMEDEASEEENIIVNTTENLVDPVEMVNKVEISIGESNTTLNNDENESERKNNLTYSEKKNLKSYLSGVYEIDEDNITIN